jgi:hypothetical protein
MMLTQLASVARRTGYPVIEVPGWKTRGRPGGMLAVRTITTHHTANGGAKGNYPSLRVVRDGKAGLSGPLAQYGIGIDGTIYVIAAGKCNHAGTSRKTDYLNPYAIGIEAEAVGVPGTKGDWPEPQMDAYARLCAALVAEFNLSVADVRAHKETCAPIGRKSDPSFNMAAFRVRVSAVNLKEAPTVAAGDINLDSDQWKDHKFTDSDVAAIGDPTLKGKSGSWSSLLRFPPAVARLRREVRDDTSQLRIDIAAVRSDVVGMRAELVEVRALVQQLIDAAAPE